MAWIIVCASLGLSGTAVLLIDVDQALHGFGRATTEGIAKLSHTLWNAGILIQALGMLCIWLGSMRLRNSLRLMDTKPDCVEPLLRCLSYPWIRETAVRKLVEVIPGLSAEEANSIPAALWRRLYAYTADGGAREVRHVVFDIALLRCDNRAIPYLERILMIRDIPQDEASSLRYSLDALTWRLRSKDETSTD
jgi:hypothetical protein